MMNLTCFRTLLSLLVLTTSDGFQVTYDQDATFKNAIEKATDQTVISNLLIDDETYSPQVPCPYSQVNRFDGHSIEGIKMNSQDSKVGSSDSLRMRYFMREMIDKAPPVALPLSHSGVTTKLIPPQRNAVARTVIGLDNMPAEYWFDNRIHTFGNTGMWGGVHALMSPLVTRMIDEGPYNGIDVRTLIAKDLRKYVNKPNAFVLDFCCGVGMSTRALSGAFKDAEFIVGLDTSPEMISVARLITKYHNVVEILQNFKVRSNFITDLVKMIIDIQIVMSPWSMQSKESVKNLSHPIYARGNAERVKVPEKSFDLVTIMYGFHEIPKSGRYRILREARRLLKGGGILAVVDISEDFVPVASMLAGEPYVLEYQQNIMQQMESIQGFSSRKSVTVVPGHVRLWLLTRKENSTFVK
jgi:ubiquinone/menaquinone biosynthesis C-methylase UbiE